MPPQVSVVMGVFNDADCVSAAIESIRAQSLTDWELVIVNDGTVTVQPPKLSGTADLSILLGDTIFELDAQMDARHQFTSDIDLMSGPLQSDVARFRHSVGTEVSASEAVAEEKPWKHKLIDP